MNPFLIAAPAGAGLAAVLGLATGAGGGTIFLALGGAVLGTVGAAIYRVIQRKQGQAVPNPADEMTAGAAALAEKAKAEAEALAKQTSDKFGSL